MTYLIIGNDSIIEKEVNDIINTNNILSTSISKYDLSISDIRDVLMAINTVSLFDGKRAIICSSIETVYDNDDLINYIKNQNDNILIFVDEKVDNKKKLIEVIKKHGKIIDTKNIDLFEYIKVSFEGYKIDYRTIMLLKDYCNNNYLKIQNEIDKLKMYKFDDKVIFDDDIRTIVKKDYDTNIFDLTNALNNRNYKTVYSVIDRLFRDGEDEFKLLSVIANNYRTIFKIKRMLLKYNDDEIIKKLKMHPYRFKILKGVSSSYNEDELLNNLKILSSYDIGVKSGKIYNKRRDFLLLMGKL